MSNHSPLILWCYISSADKNPNSLRTIVRQIYQIKLNFLAHRISCWNKFCMTGLVLLKMFNSKYMSVLKSTIWSVWSWVLNLRNTMEITGWNFMSHKVFWPSKWWKPPANFWILPVMLLFIISTTAEDISPTHNCICMTK